jgi:hypothetical protein
MAADVYVAWLLAWWQQLWATAAALASWAGSSRMVMPFALVAALAILWFGLPWILARWVAHLSRKYINQTASSDARVVADTDGAPGGAGAAETLITCSATKPPCRFHGSQQLPACN